jgi:hypothetical protein
MSSSSILSRILSKFGFSSDSNIDQHSLKQNGKWKPKCRYYKTRHCRVALDTIASDQAAYFASHGKPWSSTIEMQSFCVKFQDGIYCPYER